MSKTNFKEIIARLRSEAEFSHGVLLTLSLLEVACAILIAYIKWSSDDGFSNKLFWVLGIAYIVFAFIRLSHLRNYPSAAINELEAERELTSLQEESNRLNVLSKIHVETMKNLNIQTCKLDEDDGSLCDIGITDSLNELLKPLIDRSYYLFDTDKGIQFTYGIYLAGYKALDRGTLDTGVTIINDKQNLKSLLDKDLYSKDGLPEDKQQIQNQLRLCYSSRKFKYETIELNNKKFTQISSPMHEACREDDDKFELLGVLFVICPEIEIENKKDVELQLKIFNRIIANWMYSYNSCITGKKKLALNG